MPDLGHELLLGTFITPTNQAPQRAVALAQLTERAGLDLVTFQDHPYQAAYHDTWTLLSYVAARTDRVRIAGNVLNLPLRQPAPPAPSPRSPPCSAERSPPAGRPPGTGPGEACRASPDRRSAAAH